MGSRSRVCKQRDQLLYNFTSSESVGVEEGTVTMKFLTNCFLRHTFAFSVKSGSSAVVALIRTVAESGKNSGQTWFRLLQVFWSCSKRSWAGRCLSCFLLLLVLLLLLLLLQLQPLARPGLRSWHSIRVTVFQGCFD